jgi:selenoprotein W-related protein
LAAEIKKSFGVESKLIGSSGGVFEVEADGKKVFSKESLGRFPEDGEVVKLLTPLMG